MKRIRPSVFGILIVVILTLCASSIASDQSKTVTLKGKVFRSDTKEPIANASIVLLDEKKSEKKDNSVEAKTDEQGNFIFEKLANGKYTVSIRAWYKTQEDAPCQLLMAKTVDKDSMVMVARDKDQFVQQVFIKGFSVKAGNDVVRDFDFACKSMFGS
jgi:ABC-type microcin C transport system permease subunit YejE